MKRHLDILGGDKVKIKLNASPMRFPNFSCFFFGKIMKYFPPKSQKPLFCSRSWESAQAFLTWTVGFVSDSVVIAVRLVWGVKTASELFLKIRMAHGARVVGAEIHTVFCSGLTLMAAFLLKLEFCGKIRNNYLPCFWTVSVWRNYLFMTWLMSFWLVYAGPRPKWISTVLKRWQFKKHYYCHTNIAF